MDPLQNSALESGFSQSSKAGLLAQRRVFFLLVGVYVLAVAVYVLISGGVAGVPGSMETPATDIPLWQLVLANAALVLVLYTSLGLAGLWLARRIQLPGIFRPGAAAKEWFWQPLGWGALAGVLLIGFDLGGRWLAGFEGFIHPQFPISILASLTAGIGEEIMFRLFVMSLWAVIFIWLLGKLLPRRDTRAISLALANLLAALAFAAGHLGTAMVLAGAASPMDLAPVTLAELFLMNGLLGLLCGRAFIKNGLVAAAGIHFWADIVWHVLYGLLV